MDDRDGRIVEYERVARSEEVRGPRFVVREARGGPVLLTRLPGGTAVAFGRVCPHQGMAMDDGTLWGELVDCPHHHYQYDPRTGENVYPRRVFPPSRAAQVRGIPVYAVREEAGWIWVGAPASE